MFYIFVHDRNRRKTMTTKPINATTEVVREAMRIVAKDVRAPKAVREGKVKKIKTKAHTKSMHRK